MNLTQALMADVADRACWRRAKNLYAARPLLDAGDKPIRWEDLPERMRLEFYREERNRGRHP